jgi:hypothetical protein
MTLVITEVSNAFGCVVVGDTAVTIDGAKIVLGAEKIHYSTEANIGTRGPPALKVRAETLSSWFVSHFPMSCITALHGIRQ